MAGTPPDPHGVSLYGGIGAAVAAAIAVLASVTGRVKRPSSDGNGRERRKGDKAMTEKLAKLEAVINETRSKTETAIADHRHQLDSKLMAVTLAIENLNGALETERAVRQEQREMMVVTVTRIESGMGEVVDTVNAMRREIAEQAGAVRQISKLLERPKPARKAAAPKRR